MTGSDGDGLLNATFLQHTAFGICQWHASLVAMHHHLNGVWSLWSLLVALWVDAPTGLGLPGAYIVALHILSVMLHKLCPYSCTDTLPKSSKHLMEGGN